MAVRELGGAVSIDILVQPRASRERFGPVHGDRIKLSICAPPVDGKANEAVVRFLAELFGVARGQVAIHSGDSSRRKTVRIEGIDEARVAEALS